jgi:hypothetical protein
MPGLIVAAAITTIKNITEVASASLLMRVLLLIRWTRTATLFSGKPTADRDVCSSVAVWGQIERFCSQATHREAVLISMHCLRTVMV